MMAHWGCKKMHQLGKLILSSWTSFRQLVQRYAGRIVCWYRFLFKGWCSNPNEKYLKVKSVLCDEWHCILGAFMFVVGCSYWKKKTLNTTRHSWLIQHVHWIWLVNPCFRLRFCCCKLPLYLAVLRRGDQLPKSQGGGRSFVGRPLGSRRWWDVWFFPSEASEKEGFFSIFLMYVWIVVWQFAILS